MYNENNSESFVEIQYSDYVQTTYNIRTKSSLKTAQYTAFLMEAA